LRATIPSTIEIEHNIENTDAAILADPTQIHQLLMNICTNAYQAMYEKGGILSIKLSEDYIDTEFEVFEADLFQQLPRGEEHILLIDDEDQVLELIEKLLIQLGYTITALTNGVEALEEFRRHPDKYDLVLTDLMMPKTNGIDLAQGILETRPGMPIILFTGFGEKRTQKMSD